jgi:hypothetical protein
MKALELECKQNPRLLEAEVITSCDDEGNGYNRVHYSPSKGLFADGDFHTGPAVQDSVNAVCLN